MPKNTSVTGNFEDGPSKFDVTLSTTSEPVEFGKIGIKKKRAFRKRVSEMFIDDPMLLPQIVSPIVSFSSSSTDVVDDNHDLSLAISQSRKKNMELLQRSHQFDLPADEEDAKMELVEDAELKTSPVGSFVVSDLSEFLANVKKPERLKEPSTKSFNEISEAVEDSPVSMEIERKEVNEPEADNNNLDDLLDEPLVSTGIGATLKFLENRGMGLKLCLPNSTNSEELKLGNIKLNYFDDMGNEISAKEAYKLLSHRFHGKKPGKNKEEKKLKRLSEKKKLQSVRLDDTPLGSAMLQRTKQKVIGTSHIVLARGRKGVKAEEVELDILEKAKKCTNNNSSGKEGKNMGPPTKKSRIFGML